MGKTLSFVMALLLGLSLGMNVGMRQVFAADLPVTPPKPVAPIFYEGTAVSTDKAKYQLTGTGSLTETLLPGIASYIAGFLGAIAILFLIWAGIQFLTAEGEPDKIAQATKTAFYVIAGLLLVIFAYALVYLFLTVFAP